MAEDWEISGDAYRSKPVSDPEPTCPLTGGDCPSDPRQIAKCKAC